LRYRFPPLDLAQIGCETEFIRGDNMQQNGKKIITVGVTGASGAVLAQKMLTLLDADPHVERIHLVVSETGLRLFAGRIANHRWQPESVDPTHSRPPFAKKSTFSQTRTLALPSLLAVTTSTPWP